MTTMRHGLRGGSHCLFVLCCALLQGSAWAAERVTLQPKSERVPQYEKIEFAVSVPGSFNNPFNPDEVAVTLDIRMPDGRSARVPAFWGQPYERRQVGSPPRDWCYPAGEAGWQGRFAPWCLGRHEARVEVVTPQGRQFSDPVFFECLSSTNRGFVRVSRKDPRFLEFSEGQPFFPIGQNLAFIGSQQYVTLSKAQEIFARLAAHGANYLRVWTCCEDWAMAIEARKSAWGRSWDRRPPFAPVPGNADTNHLCVQLMDKRARVEANPSHPVALRPGTQYLVRGRAKAEGGGRLHLSVQGTRSEKPLAITGQDGWTEFTHPFATKQGDFWLGGLRLELEGGGTAWVQDLSLREASGGPELLWEAAVNRPVRGFYNPLDCFLLDELVTSAKQRGIYLQLCMLTRDVYMHALKDPASSAYTQAIADAKKFFRYAVGRWGYATCVAAWEYWNEMDPGLSTDRFYSELGSYFEEIDPYQHLRTTSTWGPSAKDCRHPKLDIADVHFYLRPPDYQRLRDEVDAVVDRTRWLREHAPNKPAHVGEFGLANEQWQPTEEMKLSPELIEMHHAFWSSALSGASGTALPWWWERLDQRNVYPLYRPVSTFVADVPWNGGEIKPVAAEAAGLHIIGLQAGRRAWAWLFDPAAAWARVVVAKQAPGEIASKEVTFSNLPEGKYRVTWWDTRRGVALQETNGLTRNGMLRVAAPRFTRDIACKIAPQE